MKLNTKTYILLLPFVSYLFYQQTIASEHKLVLAHNKNKTPLHFLFSSTLSEDDIEKTQLFLSQGAHPNITYYGNNSLLHSIIERSENHDRTCTFAQLLCEHKADINAKNALKETPLILAIKKENEELVKLLLEQGADPNVEDENGNHTIHIAMEWDTDQENHFYKKRKILPNIVMLLLQYKANPNIAYHFKGARPLHAAVFHNSAIVVQALLSCGAQKDVYDERGFTPLSLAKKYQYTNIINMFVVDEAMKSFHFINIEPAPSTSIAVNKEIKSFHLIPIESPPSSINTDESVAEKAIINENKDENKKIISYQHAPPTLITVDEEIESFHTIIIDTITVKTIPFEMNTTQPFAKKIIADDYYQVTT